MSSEASMGYKIRVTTGIFIAFLFIPIADHFIFGRNDPAHGILYSRFVGWAAVLSLLCYAKWIEGGSFILWPCKKYGFWFYPASFGALYLLAIGAGILANVPGWFGFPRNREVVEAIASILYRHIPLLIFTAITAGVVEELIFRVYLVPRLEIIFKNHYMPVIISALMFSALHFRYQSLEELLFTFFLGIVFAVHYKWYRNIGVLIATHTIIDLVSLFLHGFAQAYAQAHHIKLNL
jgi:membrane protease YdiL (CAAX protease family)